LPTTKTQRTAALELLSLKKGQHILELGAGDGAFVVDALRQGLEVTAIEINPILCSVIYIRTLKYRGKVHIKCGNFWTTQWPKTDGVYVFLLDKYMEKLDKMLIHKHYGGKLASFAFQIPGKTAERTRNGVFLYQY
jgi:16S rRNA A1518/A1519 N6-dimethyltransferase RsmA/KsgA/DIM1 with predicted DNA glycosylase/AP lyase activity